MTRSRPDPIIGFYSGAEDSERRTLAEILEWDDDRLEMVHDYIQWVFPTRQPSGVNPLAPRLTDDTIRAFGATAELRAQLRRAFDRMLGFYGLIWRDARVEIDDPRFPARARVWLRAGNHNHLRLTRIMTSLGELGLAAQARAVWECLSQIAADFPDRVTPATLEYWRAAGGRFTGST